uniref:Uncharacterized protein n=1 Tax=Anopheles albimanus TaxID=7167 RepID=A0A182FM05_ANOAL
MDFAIVSSAFLCLERYEPVQLVLTVMQLVVRFRSQRAGKTLSQRQSFASAHPVKPGIDNK